MRSIVLSPAAYRATRPGCASSSSSSDASETLEIETQVASLSSTCFIVGHRRPSPNGARFDSPGRSALGWRTTNDFEAPTGRDFFSGIRDGRFWNLAPMGHCTLINSTTQGFAALRPGLSNLAPLVMSAGARAVIANIVYFHFPKNRRRTF